MAKVAEHELSLTLLRHKKKFICLPFLIKRSLILLAGVAMTATATGCCCLGGCLGGANRCCSPGYGGGSPCGPGGCAPTYDYPPTTGYAPTQEYSAAFAPTTTITSAPMYGPAYPTTVLAPTQALPTY